MSNGILNPRSQPNADKPGAYQLATQVGTLTFKPGETLQFDQYITGYGEVSGAKIQAYFSPEVFDKEHCTVRHGLVTERRDGGHSPIGWGSQIDILDTKGFCSFLQGFKFYQGDTTCFFDLPGMDSNRVFTEVAGEHAPFEFSLKIAKTAAPGMHHVDFYLTYFNGETWTVTKERMEFKIYNQFERHNGLLSLLAAIALVVTIGHDGVAPILELAHSLGKLVSSLRHSL